MNIPGWEFVIEMQKLGYPINGDDNPNEGFYAIILDMAKKLKELEEAEKE